MTASPQGRPLELYFIDGKPDGMLTAEVFNWTGHVLMTPRTRIAAALKRTEASYTGIYLLIGEKDGAPLAYIGESENIADRVRNHDQGKDWWTSAVLITTGANNLHKAHVKYMEARLVEIARQVGRMALEKEVVLLFRPVCSLFKVDQGFISGCHSHGFGLAGMDLVGGQDAMGRVGPLGIVIGQPLADTVAGL